MPAIGAAILGAICGGAHSDFNSAIEAMKEPVLYQVEPDPQQARTYKNYSALIKNCMIYMVTKARIMRNVSALM